MNRGYLVLGMLVYGVFSILAMVGFMKAKLTVEDFMKYYDAAVEIRTKEQVQRDKARICFTYRVFPVNSKVIKVVSFIETKDNELSIQTNIVESIYGFDYSYDPQFTFNPPDIMLRSNYDGNGWKYYETLFTRSRVTDVVK